MVESYLHCRDCGKIMYYHERLGFYWCGMKNHEIITNEQILLKIPRS